jgi:hypothetical protein
MMTIQELRILHLPLSPKMVMPEHDHLFLDASSLVDNGPAHHFLKL